MVTVLKDVINANYELIMLMYQFFLLYVTKNHSVTTLLP